MHSFHFAAPWAFALLLLPLLMLLLSKNKKQTQDNAIYLPLDGLGALDTPNLDASIKTANGFTIKQLLLLIAWLSLCTALAKPIFLGDEIEQQRTGRDMLLAVDISGSMREEDMSLNNRRVDRLTLLKSVLQKFISSRDGDRLGLIVFADQAFVQAPLTFDLKTMEQLLLETQIGFAGRATAIGDAIGLGIKRLNANSEKFTDSQKVLILLTDGENTAGATEPLEAAQLAAEQGVTIYTIGLGSDQQQSRGLLGMFSVNPSAALDTKSLKQIAQMTGGKFFRATDEQSLAEIYTIIDNMELIEKDKAYIRPERNVYYYPLVLALITLLLISLIQLAQNLHAQEAQ